MKKFTVVVLNGPGVESRSTVKALNLVDAFMQFFGEAGDDIDFAQELLEEAQADGRLDVDYNQNVLCLTNLDSTYIIVGDK